jgi:ribosomal-protein-alanine N-acetyltransferase
MKIDPINEIELITERLVLKVLDSTFALKVLNYYKQNQDFFQLTMPAYDEQFLTKEYQEERLWTEFDLMCEDRGIRLYIFKKDDVLYEHIIGDVSLSNVMRGAFQSCNIGFKLDKGETGKGYMTEALKRLIDYVFMELELHRIEADVLLFNNPCIRLLGKLGFKKEGISEKYLFVNGAWQDHERYSLINPDEKYIITTE